MSEKIKESSEMELEEFDKFAEGNTPESILFILKKIVKNGGNTDCQNLKFFQIAREHFDNLDQRKGTIYEERFRKYTQEWLAGEV